MSKPGLLGQRRAQLLLEMTTQRERLRSPARRWGQAAQLVRWGWQMGRVRPLVWAGFGALAVGLWVVVRQWNGPQRSRPAR